MPSSGESCEQSSLVACSSASALGRLLLAQPRADLWVEGQLVASPLALAMVGEDWQQRRSCGMRLRWAPSRATPPRVQGPLPLCARQNANEACEVLLHPMCVQRTAFPWVAHRCVPPRANLLQPPGCKQGFPPPCLTQRRVEPCAALSHPLGCSQRGPPPCLMHRIVAPCADLAQPGCRHLSPPPCALHLCMAPPRAYLLQPATSQNGLRRAVWSSMLLRLPTMGPDTPVAPAHSVRQPGSRPRRRTGLGLL